MSVYIPADKNYISFSSTLIEIQVRSMEEQFIRLLLDG